MNDIYINLYIVCQDQQVFFRKVIRIPMSTSPLASMSVMTTSKLIATYGGGASYDPQRDVIWLIGGYSDYEEEEPVNLVQYWSVQNNSANTWDGILDSSCVSGANAYNTIYQSSSLWFGAPTGLCQYQLVDDDSNTTTRLWTWPNSTSSNATAIALNTDFQDILYIVTSDHIFWIFDINAAINNLANPWDFGIFK
ncbi:hypothetical protein RFI_14903 [Reticulomyxa filosa]|uniref:Uncharacterized protein n=1 Tax=Reticulomyxa filosa TaxID=46433 RepID=X6N7M8_RETFI|nr:hypothetical protein RFI_14903 [Reticulomyxa filosa]|eukprot:ETO22295.1 hypothetical protein RFI_14903 [Reticulomyxa filosa]